MTSKEFVKWLEGFLDGVEKLTPCHEKEIREKMETIQDPIQLTWPYQPYYDPGIVQVPHIQLIEDCPNGGSHEYDFNSTSPNTCTKCGRWTENGLTVTYTTSCSS